MLWMSHLEKCGGFGFYSILMKNFFLDIRVANVVSMYCILLSYLIRDVMCTAIS